MGHPHRLRLPAFALSLCLVAGQVQAAPNIVVVLIDDMGAAVIGPERRSVSVATPNIDALAAAGTTFTQAYAAPVCAQARAMLMAGRWQQRHSVGAIWTNTPSLPASVVTIAERLRGHGYATAIIGKWHLGFTAGRHPLDQGFDSFYGFRGATPAYSGHDAKAPLFRNRTRIRNTGYVTDTLADEAVRVLGAARSTPLFLYVPLTAIHDPLQTTPEVAVQGVDRAVGRIVAAAKADTLFILAGDNGRRNNAPLKGGKYSIWEGGVRVPFMMTWTGHVPADRRLETPVTLLDVAATSLAAAGAPVPRDLDGLNLLAPVPVDRRVFFGAYGRAGYAVRQGRWKLYLDYEGVPIRLYDVLRDKGETRNVAAGNAPVVRLLTQAIDAWKQAIND